MTRSLVVVTGHVATGSKRFLLYNTTGSISHHYFTDFSYSNKGSKEQAVSVITRQQEIIQVK